MLHALLFFSLRGVKGVAPGAAAATGSTLSRRSLPPVPAESLLSAAAFLPAAFLLLAW